MTDQLIPYMTAAVATHALLLSLGGLMALNGVRSLAQVQQQGWDVYVDALARNVSIIDVPARNEQIEQVKKWTVRFTYVDLALGCIGILYALVAIGFLSETPLARAHIVVSLLLVFFQLWAFVLIAWGTMHVVGWWIKKAP